MAKAFWDYDDMVGVHAWNDTHRKFRAEVRKFMDEEIIPHVDDWEVYARNMISPSFSLHGCQEKAELPSYLAERAYRAGVYQPNGRQPYLAETGNAGQSL